MSLTAGSCCARRAYPSFWGAPSDPHQLELLSTARRTFHIRSHQRAAAANHALQTSSPRLPRRRDPHRSLGRLQKRLPRFGKCTASIYLRLFLSRDICKGNFVLPCPPSCSFPLARKSRGWFLSTRTNKAIPPTRLHLPRFFPHLWSPSRRVASIASFSSFFLLTLYHACLIRLPSTHLALWRWSMSGSKELSGNKIDKTSSDQNKKNVF